MIHADPYATKGGRGCKRISSDKASNLPKRDVIFFVEITTGDLLLYVPSQQLWSLRDGQFT